MARQDGPRGPALTPAGLAAKAERERRQAEQLRRNLLKRKAQQRARGVASETPESDPD